MDGDRWYDESMPLRARVGQAYNFSTERPLSVLEVVQLLQALLGIHLEPDVRAIAASEIDAQHLSAARARSELGWAPRCSLDEALTETIAWYRSDLGIP